MALDAYFVIYLIVEFIFYVFHLSILFLVIVKQNEKFKGAFYNIFRIVLVVDFLNFIANLILTRISLIPYLTNFYETSVFFTTFMSLFTLFFVVMQFVCRLFMAFNRFTVIWFPLQYTKIWQRQWYTVLSLLLAFLSICWRFDDSVRYIYLPNGNIFPVFEKHEKQQTIKALSSLILFVTTIAAAIFNGLAFAKFYYKKRQSSNYQVNEQHLLYMSIIILLAQLLRVTLPLSQYLFPTDSGVIKFFSYIFPLLTDVLALSGSISFFVLSKIARKEYAKFYFNKKSAVSVQTKPVTPIQ